MSLSPSRKEITAWLIDAPYESFMAYIDLGPEGVRVVGPDGRKHVFSQMQLVQAQHAMGFDQTLAEVAISPQPSAVTFDSRTLATEEEAKSEAKNLPPKPAPAPKVKAKAKTSPKTPSKAKPAASKKP